MGRIQQKIEKKNFKKEEEKCYTNNSSIFMLLLNFLFIVVRRFCCIEIIEMKSFFFFCFLFFSFIQSLTPSSFVQQQKLTTIEYLLYFNAQWVDINICTYVCTSIDG